MTLKSPDRYHTKPLSRVPRRRYRPQRIWAYRHSKICAHDVAVLATALGITESALIETALRIGGPLMYSELHERIARIARDVLRQRFVSIADQADAMAAAIITELERPDDA